MLSNLIFIDLNLNFRNLNHYKNNFYLLCTNFYYLKVINIIKEFIFPFYFNIPLNIFSNYKIIK